ncbi:capsular polysaccharide export protein KpsC [Oceanicola granulosus HTCC2516]|uniref:Capsular polysaccharide export protein KpsC n=1 Tax=Oceanicola granulosus (strain ATCC BAA-861 / DSM 15982 / KCTC 12143 / HTCC2516) TaxID=314256 RepID=Q2CIK3_OCEGH|nr:capsular polysaccharide biosynthesis protein [Oceanicola granulosus]EAR52586.1 capsular polysaccharide export protein KpsC [Oceanicola granulosus HTCC2516]
MEGEAPARKLYVYNGGFLTQGRVRRILTLAGYDIRLGTPGADDLVGVWGQSPTSPRGEAVAARRDAPLLRVEDAFLRSVLPGRAGGGAPLGLHLDLGGVHFDTATISDLERLCAEAPLDDTALLDRARDAMADLRRLHLSKYTGFDPDLPPPPPGYVLVIDQTRDDASVRASKAGRNSFLEMLFTAREDHPGARIVVKSHPETSAGARPGHIGPDDLGPGDLLLSDPVSPWHLLEGAVAVYVVSSQLGFEAILAGHRPVVFGQPFYAGWSLTDDRRPLDRRQRRLTRAQLFAAAMILYPRWYDPFRDRLCELEDAIAIFAAETRAWRDDRRGWVATGMRLWKRKPLQDLFGRQRRVRFVDRPAPAIARAAAEDRRLMVWAGRTDAALEAAGAVRVEDGFLRSRGLGADLVPPLSLVLDDLGIYYDPTRESRLEHLVAAATGLPEGARRRAERLVRRLTGEGLSKYNLGGGGLPAGLPAGRRILVPGQVEDDASIRLGTGEISTNRALLAAVRAANPAAFLLYKPHPDVEAGLRAGAVDDAESLADAVLTRTDPVAALAAVDEVWTMTSTLGFEALLRGKRVVTLGRPFYAGWGLTDDRGAPPARRTARPDLAAFVHAVLIDYPRYHDPVTGRPCPVEVAVERLARGELPRPGRINRLLAKAQGVMAGQAWLWR